MRKSTGIEWTEKTWNPLAGCTPVSAGCLNCYAATMANRLHGMTLAGRKVPGYEGAPLTALRNGRRVFTGEVRTLEHKLTEPLSWRKPAMVFVNSMSDLFHESVPFEFIDRVFAVMALTPHLTYQVLTKRPERMAAYLAHGERNNVAGRVGSLADKMRHGVRGNNPGIGPLGHGVPGDHWWPLANVWLGTSVEDQAAADQRIPHLLRCPAVVRFLSCEPLIGEVRFSNPELGIDLLRSSTRTHLRLDVAGALRNKSFDGFICTDSGRKLSRSEAEAELRGLLASGVRLIPMGDCDNFDPEKGCRGHKNPGIDWVIIGGESGARSRPCDVAWVRSIVAQCRDAGVPCFVKQLGARPVESGRTTEPSLPMAWDFDDSGEQIERWYRPKDRKGGDPSEWPEWLRVREWPGGRQERGGALSVREDADISPAGGGRERGRP